MLTGRSNGGFTIIELLIVILIIGIISAIAVPAILGQRERARIKTMLASAKGIERELAMIINDYGRGMPVILATEVGKQGCFENQKALKAQSCSYLFSDTPKSGTYTSISDLISTYKTHQNKGLMSISPFDGQPIISTDSTPASRNGHVLIINSNEYSLHVSSWTPDGTELTNTILSTR